MYLYDHMLLFFKLLCPLAIRKPDRHQDSGAVDSTVKCVRQGRTAICQPGPGLSPITAEVLYTILETKKGPGKRLQTG